MLDQQDLKWIATTSTELNSVLQQVARYADLARQPKAQANYLDLLAERVEVASKTAQALFDRVTSSILEGSVAKKSASAKAPTLSIVPAPTPGLAAVGKAIAEARSKKSPAAPSPLPPPAEIPILNPEGARELILLVDDEVEVSRLAAEMLTDEGYRVIMAKDGFEALRIYKQMGRRIGLVILDFFLPIMDGDAVFDELRALNPAISVVLSSGFAEQTKLGAMLALGLRGFIPKPYTSEKLLSQVRMTLDAAPAAVA